jgi:diacylglycerol kinase (CTP)
VAESVKLADVDEALERTLNPNGYANGSAHQNKTRQTSPAKKIDWEIPRKLFHSSIGFVTLYLYASHGSPERVVVVLSSAMLIIVPADILRLNYPPFERTYERMVGFLMRESEKNHTNGVIWYIVGVVFVLALYPLDVAVLSIMILSWADTAASTFGRLWGSRTPPLPARVPFLGLPLAPRKSLAGFLAAFVTGTAVVFSFWSWFAPAVGGVDPTWDWTRGVSGPGVDGSSLGQGVRTILREAGFEGLPTGGIVGLVIVSLFSGLVTGIAEALDLGNLDDNLTLPILSGGCIWGFLKLFSWFSS